MKDGFIKVAVATPKVKVANVEYNKAQIITAITKGAERGAKLLVTPELSLTAYTCGDLFFSSALIQKAKEALLEIAEKTAHLDILSVVGAPVCVNSKLINGAVFIKDGKILGIASKAYLPNFGEFNEARYFAPLKENTVTSAFGYDVPAGPKLIFTCNQMDNFSVAAEICEDMWVNIPPGCCHAQNGATVLVNLSANNEIVGKTEARHLAVKAHSRRTMTAYLYADAGIGESSTDLVFSGHKMIYECGSMLGEIKPFKSGVLYCDIDVDRIATDRQKRNTFIIENDESYTKIPFDTQVVRTGLSRSYHKHPFVPHSIRLRGERCSSILEIQAQGLQKRLAHTNCKNAVIGISGGLDSTLALLVTVSAFDALNIPRENITAVTMPCFGTTDRTYNNAVTLIKSLGASFREVNIKKSVLTHLEDIGASPEVHNTTYENAQARERTQVLMDIANQNGGLVIGTGDLSELALGWATYNGDHMSMYSVNCSVPKTLVRHLVEYSANRSDGVLKDVLNDILDTPVSPELLPPTDDGEIAQTTEDIVGPYELHDFFLFYFVRFGFKKEKIQRICEIAFDGVYTSQTIEKWLDIFYRRFFQNQFKRSCVPDGPKVGSVGLSPRGDWQMPSDACLFES